MSGSSTWSPITPDDVDDWARVLDTVATADGSDERYRTEDLLEELHEPEVDPVRDTVFVRDAAGAPVGYGQVRVRRGTDRSGIARAGLWGGVVPAARRGGLGRRLLAWSESRARDLVAEQHPGRPATVTLMAPEAAAATMRLATVAGYEQVRWFLEMTRALERGEASSEPDVPADLLLRQWRPQDAAALYRAHVSAFADHWQWAAPSEDAWRAEFASRTARPELSVVITDRAGGVLAYVDAHEYEDRQLYIGRVGTVPAARGRGLARLALAETLRRAAAAGNHDLAKLDVDADSPTGAGRLYEGLGFVPVTRTAACQRTL